VLILIVDVHVSTSSTRTAKNKQWTSPALVDT
jgi:hypothetical protein